MKEHVVLTQGSMEELEYGAAMEARWWRDVGPRVAEDGGVMEARGRRRSGWSHGGAGVAGLRCWSATVAAFRRERDVVAVVWQELHSGVSYGGRTWSGRPWKMTAAGWCW